MFTTVAFYESIDPNAVFVNLAALADEHIFTAGDDLRVPTLNKIVALAAGVASGGSGLLRLESPSMRNIFRHYVAPVNGNADADAEPEAVPIVSDYRRNPITLQVDEQVQAFIDSQPGSARAQWLIMWLADGRIEPASGEILTIHTTNTDTLTADAWTNGALTFDEVIGRGRYQIVGMRANSAGLVAARLVFRGGSNWRPGVLGLDADDDLDWPGFRNGGMGVFGEFESTTPPSVDFLSISGDSAQEVYLDLIKVA